MKFIHTADWHLGEIILRGISYGRTGMDSEKSISAFDR